MKFVILGNGIAGLTAAIEIRKRNQTSEVTIISEEPYLSYSRPMITKAPLKGFDMSKFIIKDEAWYKEQNIQILTNKRIVEIKPKQKSIQLDDQSEITYDKCIYALGAKSFVPPIPGVNKEGVLTVRTINDIANLRTKMLSSKTAVVIGGGVIGLEIAWELKKADIQVTILEQASHLMGALLDHQSAKKLEDNVVAAGIAVQTGINIKQINEEKQVILVDGPTYSADLTIVACGIRPNIELAIHANIQVGRAVIVNEKMETNMTDIYACGDCAEYKGINYGLWEQSIEQGKIAAANCCGEKLHYEGIERMVLFNGMKTCLFAMGDLSASKHHVIETYNKETNHFMVNNPLVASEYYEKYFFKDSYLVGVVLIGDLRKMASLKHAINEKWSAKKLERLVQGC